MNNLIGLCIVVFLTANKPVDDKPKILNMANLNTAANEDDPCPSPDGQQFLFSTDENKQRELYLASRKKPGEPLSRERVLDELVSEGATQSPFLLPKINDWEYLYFATQYHTDKKKPNYDIYRAGRFNPRRPFQGQSAASPVQSIATDADEAFPWLSSDGKVMYFSRRTAEGWQQMQVTASEPLAFGKPSPVNIPAGYHHACLFRNHLRLIVQGPLQPGEEKLGLFVCKRASSTGTWSAPEALTSINSAEGRTISPALSADNRFLYFASDRPGGQGGLDLYVVPVQDVNELQGK